MPWRHMGYLSCGKNILAEDFYGSPQFLQASAKIVPQIRLQLLPLE
jgi:hypothetical protein